MDTLPQTRRLPLLPAGLSPWSRVLVSGSESLWEQPRSGNIRRNHLCILSFFSFFSFFFLHNEAPADRFTTDCLSGNYHLSRINQGNPVLSRGEEVFTFPDETIRALIKSPCTEPPCRPAPSKEQWNSRTVLIISCIGSFQQSVCEPRGDFQVQPKNRPFYIRGCSQAVT